MDIRDLGNNLYLHRRGLVAGAVAVAVALVVWVILRQPLWETATAPPPSPVLPPAPPPVAVVEASSPPPAPVEERPAIRWPSVLVATRDLRPGDALSDAVVEWREWREVITPGTVLQQNLETVRELRGWVVAKGYTAGEPISWTGLAAPDQSSTLRTAIDPGMRAVTVEADRATTTASVIGPGDRVDVILVAEGVGAGAVAQTILRNVQVLAVGTVTLSAMRRAANPLGFGNLVDDGRRDNGGDTFTLEVSPGDADRIALAASSGRLTLAIRGTSPEASEGPLQAAVRLDDILVGEPVTLNPSVRIIRGSATANVAVGAAEPTQATIADQLEALL